MKRFLYVCCLYILTKSSGLSQDHLPIDNVKLIRKGEFFIPGLSHPSSFQDKYNWTQFTQGMIFKSPIKHQAVFCRLEDITQKKMRIVFQLHVGDYTSKMDMVVPH